MNNAFNREVDKIDTETIEAKKSYLTRREWIEKYCDFDDIDIINRMAQWYISKRTKDGDPIWVKEEVYEEWMDGPFDYKEFAEAKKPRAERGSIPKSFWQTWGYKSVTKLG